MASRIRTIKPDFFRHEELYMAEKESGLPLRVAFAGLFTVADREGRFKWKPKQLKFDVLPYDDVDFDLVLSTLAKHDFIRAYEVDGKQYAYIPSFTSHQVINNKESKSILPEPTRENTRLSRDVVASLTEGKEGKGREGNIQVACAVCSIFGKHYLLPQERLSQTANWFKIIDEEVGKILQVHKPDEAVKQITAYLRHCKSTDRKVIGTNYKVAETILGANWTVLNAPDHVPKENDFSEAEFNRKNWTDDAWRKQYQKQIISSEPFRRHFNITTQ